MLKRWKRRKKGGEEVEEEEEVVAEKLQGDKSTYKTYWQRYLNDQPKGGGG